METTVEYFCEENKHPLEDTYGKSRVCISVWDEGWVMMESEGLDPTAVVMINFAHELMKRNKRLEEELKAQKEARKRSQKMADDVATPVVSNVFDGSGELIAGVASVEAVVRFLQQYTTENFITPSWIYRFRHHITNAPLVMLDANLPPESLKAACITAYESGVPVLFEPVSVVKSRRIAPVAEYVTCTSPNEIELVAMANSLSPSVKYNFHKIEQFKEKADSVEYLFEMLSPAMFFLLEKGIKLLIVTLGSNGVFICCKEHTNFMKDQRKCKQTLFSRQLLEKMDGCFPLCGESSSRTCVFHLPAISASVISLTGAGDCLVGGVLSALFAGFDIIQSVAIGVATAKASVESEANVPDDISAANIADDAQSVLHSAKVLWCK
uniref:Putative fructokinase 6 n=1 Tax=Saccharum spontaneum TaxID=62335 RepID=A0A1L2YZH9_SACSP|nr:putative fructokinase 6 [Saccharum spontaneum]